MEKLSSDVFEMMLAPQLSMCDLKNLRLVSKRVNRMVDTLLQKAWLAFVVKEDHTSWDYEFIRARELFETSMTYFLTYMRPTQLEMLDARLSAISRLGLEAVRAVYGKTPLTAETDAMFNERYLDTLLCTVGEMDLQTLVWCSERYELHFKSSAAERQFWCRLAGSADTRKLEWALNVNPEIFEKHFLTDPAFAAMFSSLAVDCNLSSIMLLWERVLSKMMPSTQVSRMIVDAMDLAAWSGKSEVVCFLLGVDALSPKMAERLLKRGVDVASIAVTTLLMDRFGFTFDAIHKAAPEWVEYLLSSEDLSCGVHAEYRDFLKTIRKSEVKK